MDLISLDEPAPYPVSFGGSADSSGFSQSQEIFSSQDSRQPQYGYGSNREVLTSSVPSLPAQREPELVARTGLSSAADDRSSDSPANKLVSFTSWGVGQIKNARQVMLEKLGKAERTEDPELEKRVEKFNDSRRKLRQLKVTSQQLLQHTKAATATQHLLTAQFRELAVRTPELRSHFERNAATQEVVARHAESLIVALEFFESNLDTMVHKTMEDTLDATRAYEEARISYDVLRLELLAKTPTGAQCHQLELRREAFQKVRESLWVKLDLMTENTHKVLRKQLTLLNNTMCAFYSGNEMALKQAIAEIGTGYDQPMANFS